jgi:hypothetical protein
MFEIIGIVILVWIVWNLLPWLFFGLLYLIGFIFGDNNDC